MWNVLFKLQQSLPFTVLKRNDFRGVIEDLHEVVTAPTVYGMRRRGRGSRGAR